MARQWIQPYGDRVRLMQDDPTQVTILPQKLGGVGKPAPCEEHLVFAFRQLAQRGQRTRDVRLAWGTVARQPQQIDDARRHLPDFIAQHCCQLADPSIAACFKLNAAYAPHLDIEKGVRLKRHGEIRSALL